MGWEAHTGSSALLLTANVHRESLVCRLKRHIGLSLATVVVRKPRSISINRNSFGGRERIPGVTEGRFHY